MEHSNNEDLLFNCFLLDEDWAMGALVPERTISGRIMSRRVIKCSQLPQLRGPETQAILNVYWKLCRSLGKHRSYSSNGFIEGDGIVITDRSDYITKMKPLLKESLKFTQLPKGKHKTIPTKNLVATRLVILGRQGLMDTIKSDRLRRTGSIIPRIHQSSLHGVRGNEICDP